MVGSIRYFTLGSLDSPGRGHAEVDRDVQSLRGPCMTLPGEEEQGHIRGNG